RPPWRRWSRRGEHDHGHNPRIGREHGQIHRAAGTRLAHGQPEDRQDHARDRRHLGMVGGDDAALRVPGGTRAWDKRGTRRKLCRKYWDKWDAVVAAPADYGTPIARAPYSDDFNWSPENGDVIVAPQQAIAVYRNAWGQIVIRAAGWPEDDAFVVVSPEHLPALIAKLSAILKEAD